MRQSIRFELAIGSLLLVSSQALYAQTAPMVAVSPRPPTVVHYKFSMSKPPLLSAYKGAIYDVPSDDLQQVAGTAEYDVHTSAPVAPSQFLNTDKHIKLVHSYYWTLSSVPVRYANDITYKVKNTVGYTKTDFESTEKTLGASAGAKVFGISASVKASLKLTTTETTQWHEETITDTDQTFKGHFIYCTWTLVDSLDTIVDTRVSTDAADQPAGGNPTRTEASFRYAALIYQDDAPDPGAVVLTNAARSFSTSVKSVLGAPKQF